MAKIWVKTEPVSRFRWSRRHSAPIRDDYMTRAEHQAEAERLVWVIDDVIQSGAKRSLSDLIALARLHLDLAGPSRAPRPPGEQPVMPP